MAGASDGFDYTYIPLGNLHYADFPERSTHICITQVQRLHFRRNVVATEYLHIQGGQNLHCGVLAKYLEDNLPNV